MQYNSENAFGVQNSKMDKNLNYKTNPVGSKHDFVSTGLFAAPEELAQRHSGSNNSPQKHRSMFMRDRDRILYSKAFRRLSGKTQIYRSGSDDHQRNRLTHTLEVSQIALTIATALGLNRDLTEAIALGHDLGHTPFGHAGEQMLHKLSIPNKEEIIEDTPLREDMPRIPGSYGFKHNLQSVRMAATLENIYGNEALDLTNYTLWGIQKHSSSEYSPQKMNAAMLKPDIYDQYNCYYALKSNSNNVAWSFEAFVVAEADEIAQFHHDLEDAIRGNAMTRDKVTSTVEKNLRNIMSDADKDLLGKMHSNSIDDDTYIVYLSRVVVNSLVTKIIDASIENLNYIREKYKVNHNSKKGFFVNNSPQNEDIASAISYNRIGSGNDVSNQLKKYSKTISTNVHNSYTVHRMNTKGQYIIKKLYEAYYKNPQQLPNHSMVQFLISVGAYQTTETAMRQVSTHGEGYLRTKFLNYINAKKNNTQECKLKLIRVICDHIASMTDNYAIEEFKHLYN